MADSRLLGSSRTDDLETIFDSIEIEILTSPATSIAKKISERVYSSETVVRTFIKRIEAVNPSLNAVVTKRFEVREITSLAVRRI